LIDIVSGDEATKRRPGTELLCVVPKDLGAPVDFRAISGRIVLETESGITMIVPQHAARDR
jgi:hypothetical protein